jgi:nucleotide-binding universal stress UspA family protein
MGHIVVGIDGSDVSRRALAWAVSEGRLRGAVVEAVYVYEHTPSWQLYAYGPEGTYAIPDEALSEQEPELAQAAARRAQQLVEDQVATLGVNDVEINPVAVEDRRPAKALVEQASDAELLVVGSRGRGGFAGLLLGSVSQQCAQHARCPVVIIGPVEEE